TDLSLHALERAKQGIYSAERIDDWAKCYSESGGRGCLSEYYTAAYDGIAIRESLRRNVSFFHHNLVSDYAFGEMHVIFCRNVLIYFGDSLRERVLAQFAKSLYPGGFLCLGSSERLNSTAARGLFANFASNERIYRYEGA